MQHGGDLVGAALCREGVQCLFTLCGGHISPLLVGAKARGIDVVDMRDERSAVFAADAAARLTGIVGVAALTAGPGVTNSITALKNAQLNQSPVLVLGGATATLLRGRGALQDIDQLALVESTVKWSARVTRVAAIPSTLARACEVARSGVPGPVFVEIPVDLLYPEAIVQSWYDKESAGVGAASLRGRLLAAYLKAHLFKQFRLPDPRGRLPEFRVPEPRAPMRALERLASWLSAAERPALVIGGQVLVNSRDPGAVARAVQQLGVPVWLAGGARGLLGRSTSHQFRHARTSALRQADLVILAGFPCDFRLKYGRAVGTRARVASINLSAKALSQNRRPELGIQRHPGQALVELARLVSGTKNLAPWVSLLTKNERDRDRAISAQARTPGKFVQPLRLLQAIEAEADDDALFIVDGGDFAASAAYVLRPRAPLSWLDPGVFGTLGVGGGFAVAAAKCRPGKEIWLLYGDGASAFSLSEIDTSVRHGLAPIAIIGNDASWSQIARDQIALLGDDVGTVLRRTPYHRVAEGYGGVGLLLEESGRVEATLAEAKRIAREGKPVVVNAHLATSDFREGSISL